MTKKKPSESPPYIAVAPIYRREHAAVTILAAMLRQTHVQITSAGAREAWKETVEVLARSAVEASDILLKILDEEKPA